MPRAASLPTHLGPTPPRGPRPRGRRLPLASSTHSWHLPRSAILPFALPAPPPPAFPVRSPPGLRSPGPHPAAPWTSFLLPSRLPSCISSRLPWIDGCFCLVPSPLLSLRPQARPRGLGQKRGHPAKAQERICWDSLRRGIIKSPFWLLLPPINHPDPPCVFVCVCVWHKEPFQCIEETHKVPKDRHDASGFSSPGLPFLAYEAVHLLSRVFLSTFTKK